MKQIQDYTFNIPVNDDFINDKKINDLLYIWLLIHSYFNSELKIRIVLEKQINFSKLQKELNITRKTLRSDFKYLVCKEYLVFDNINKNYIIKNINNSFVEISSFCLQHMLTTNLRNIVKVYSLLKFYYNVNKDDYNFFTQKILLDKIGYSNVTTSNYKIIKDIIFWLEKNKYLMYYKIKERKKIKKIYKIL